MPVQRVAATELLPRLGGFDQIIDARSESEFAEDHLPGACNWPTLTDAQRRIVGTQYKQVSAFDARKQGAAWAAANIASHLQQHVQDLPRHWQPLVYCWRGGQRSGSLALVLGEIGFAVTVLDGGYQAFRRAVLPELEALPQRLSFVVLCGRTGSAKSRLLQTLAREGAQVLDLEALACHRGSVLGPEPGCPQPGQKAFETRLWRELSALDPARPVFAESESRTVGRLRVPLGLIERLRASPCVRVELPLPARVEFLLQDYAHLVADTEEFCRRLQPLRELRGHAVVDRWQAAARRASAADPEPLRDVVRELLTDHYDPVYLRSMHRHFAGLAQATVLELQTVDPPTLVRAARHLMQAHASGATAGGG